MPSTHGRTPLRIPVPSRPSSLKLSKQHASHKSDSQSTRSKRDSRSEFEESDSDMAALPHFCTTCEKQIMHPSHSILYCSTACRRKDGANPAPPFELSLASPSMSDMDAMSSYPDIVPLRSPTIARPSSISSEDGGPYTERPAVTRHESEAARYLSQFRPGGQISCSPSRSASRPAYYRNAKASSSATLPSLSHTPASSMDSSYSSHISRTTPTRLPPWSLRHNSSRSIELVVPASSAPAAKVLPAVRPVAVDGDTSSLTSSHSTSTAVGLEEDGLVYEKKSVSAAITEGQGSLRQLLADSSLSPPSSKPETRGGV